MAFFSIPQLSSFYPSVKTNVNIDLEGLRSYKCMLFNKPKCSSSFICVQCHCSTTSLSTELALGTARDQAKFSHGDVDGNALHRSVVRLGLPSKGRMADDTLVLLKDCQLGIRQANPRQYDAYVPGVSVFFRQSIIATLFFSNSVFEPYVRV